VKATKRILAIALMSTVMAVAAPSDAFANHDCGPPDKHNDHAKGPEDRKVPCK
jgi:hypothetical protein